MTTIPKEAVDAFIIAKESEDRRLHGFHNLGRHFILDGTTEVWFMVSDDYEVGHTAMMTQLERLRAEAALSAALPHLSKTVDAERHERAIPEGWQLVPKEPSMEMCKAGNIARIDSKTPFWTEVMELSYRAMLAAAPQLAVAVKYDTTIATVSDHNAAFDPADDALGGAFKDGFREGWLFAKTPDFEDREELEEDYPHIVDIAPSECWDAYREKYFAMLPLAAIPEVGSTLASPPPAVAEEVGVNSLTAVSRDRDCYYKEAIEASLLASRAQDKLSQINNIIFAKGAPLGSTEYFEIREIASSTLSSPPSEPAPQVVDKAECVRLRKALDGSMKLIDRLMHVHVAPDECTSYVKQSSRWLLDNGGTLACIADQQEANRTALASQEKKG